MRVYDMYQYWKSQDWYWKPQTNIYPYILMNDCNKITVRIRSCSHFDSQCMTNEPNMREWVQIKIWLPQLLPLKLLWLLCGGSFQVYVTQDLQLLLLEIPTTNIILRHIIIYHRGYSTFCRAVKYVMLVCKCTKKLTYLQ